jgi:hypothetical protein
MGSCPKAQSADSAAPSKITMTNTRELTVVYHSKRHSERSRGISNLKIKMNG